MFYNQNLAFLSIEYTSLITLKSLKITKRIFISKLFLHISDHLKCFETT